MKNIAIIGAGAGGLAAAYDLVQAGHQVTVYEQESRPGGLAAGFKEPEWDWELEKFYHHWFQSDHAILGLIDELGLSKKVEFHQPTTVMYYNGEFYPFDTPMAALKFPGLSFIGKMRFGFVTVFLKYFAKWQPLEKYTAHEWMKKYYGDKVYSTMLEPMLVGKFSSHYQDVNMAWFWARFKARTPRLGTFQGGFQSFLDNFAEILKQKGVHFNFNTGIRSIQPLDDGRIELDLENGKATFDQVLATVPPFLLAKLTPALDEAYRNKLTSLKSIGAVVLILSIKKPLSKQGYYWFNLPKSSGFPFLALVEHTNFLSPDHYNGAHLIYCGDYLENSHEYFSLSKEEMVARFLPSLKRINPEFEEDWLVDSWLFRAPYAQPVPGVNHSEKIPAIQTPVANLYFASMSQVYPWDRGTNYAVELGRKAAGIMLAAGEKPNP
jgi:protoporphyrinogen oxidase